MVYLCTRPWAGAPRSGSSGCPAILSYHIMSCHVMSCYVMLFVNLYHRRRYILCHEAAPPDQVGPPLPCIAGWSVAKTCKKRNCAEQTCERLAGHLLQAFVLEDEINTPTRLILTIWWEWLCMSNKPAKGSRDKPAAKRRRLASKRACKADKACKASSSSFGVLEIRNVDTLSKADKACKAPSSSFEQACKTKNRRARFCRRDRGPAHPPGP